MHSIIKSIIKFKNKRNQSKNEQINHSKNQLNYSINNNEINELEKIKEYHNIKTIRKSIINVLHNNKQSSNENYKNQYNNNNNHNNNRLSNDKDDHIDLLDNHQINDQIMMSSKLIESLPNYEDLCHNNNDDMDGYQQYKQTIQQINSILSNPLLINQNYTEEELNNELEKLLQKV
ncbi:unnamed protein product [Schistosoma spindalis]|nr:unnamed protein product [Schistosoma spindale]